MFLRAMVYCDTYFHIFQHQPLWQLLAFKQMACQSCTGSDSERLLYARHCDKRSKQGTGNYIISNICPTLIKACLVIFLWWVMGVVKLAVSWCHSATLVSRCILTILSGSTQKPNWQLAQLLIVLLRAWASLSQPLHSPAVQWALKGQSRKPVTDSHCSLLS